MILCMGGRVYLAVNTIFSMENPVLYVKSETLLHECSMVSLFFMICGKAMRSRAMRNRTEASGDERGAFGRILQWFAG